jgi:hypothetical protein
VTKSEHVARARDFMDTILEVNKRHGVSETPGAIKYDAAVKAAAKRSRRVRKGSDSTSRKST